MREKIGSAIAAFIFMAVLPLLVADMMPHIDPAVGWPAVGGSVLIGVTALLWGFTPHHLRKWRAKMGPVLVMGLGLAMYGCGALWYYFAHEISRPTSESSALSPPTAPARNDSTAVAPELKSPAIVEPTLFVQCQARTLPTKSDANGMLYIYGIQKGYSGLERLWTSEPSSPIDLSGTGWPMEAWQCYITNDSASALKDITWSFGLEFREAVPTGPSSSQSGKVIESRHGQFYLPRLDAGKQNQFIFYVQNTTEDFVQLVLPEYGTASRIDEDAVRQVRLVQPQGGAFYMSLSPAPLKARPTAPPPAQEPPGPREKN